MAKVVTENFRVESTNEFVDSFADANGNNYYIMASSVNEDSTIANTQKDIREFQRKVVFGNKIDSNNVRYMFNIKPWVTGTVYDIFDDTQDMSTKNFYVTVLDGTINETSYKVYKCLRNNNGAPSTDSPPTSELDSEYEITSGDGYVWKYLFDVPPAQYLLFGTSKFLPFIPNPIVTANATQSISDILITDVDAGAFKPYLIGEDATPTQGTIASVSSDIIVDQYQLQVTCSKVPKNATDAYTNMYIRTTNGHIFDIVESSIPANVDSTTNKTLNIFVKTPINLNNEAGLSGGACFIVPKIEITEPDDSTGTQAIAYGVLSNEGTLTSINFKTKGSGYTSASAQVKAPPALQFSDTSVRTIVSPTGGHGSDPVHELFMSKVGTVTSFVTDTNTNIPDSNQYTKIGLVKNPTFRDGTYPADFDNRVGITVSEVLDESQVAVGSVVKQASSYDVDGNPIGTEVVGIVHEVKQLGVTTGLFIVDNVGTYSKEFATGDFQIFANEGDANTSYQGTIFAVNAQHKYNKYSGEVMHFVDFDPITRTATSKEKVKLIFDF
jgi:hypothetical protein